MSAPGTFLLTFDVELLWGLFFDRRWRERATKKYGAVREVFPEILALLSRHDVRATFAFVGHLFLESCEHVDGRAHPDMPRPTTCPFPGDWYDFDPGTDLKTDPLWYGRDLVKAVHSARPEHEFGGHGFSHAFLDDRPELARAEMRACRAAAEEIGVTLRSFVYPQDRVANESELAPAGFTCFRSAGVRRGRLRALLDRIRGAAPPVGRPVLRDGVVEVPTSATIPPAMGIRRLISMSSRLAEVRKGLTAARDEGAVFHLFTHPHNFVEHRSFMLQTLDRALAEVAAFRERGEIRVLTMGEVRP
jgi:peptidoglycan/xylan/chitin deacetylase (PgdA/CDA1 family)